MEARRDSPKPKSPGGLIAIVIIIPVAVVAATLAVSPSDYALYSVIRAAGLLGYISVFLSCLSSALVREMMRYFGRPYLKVHHALAAVGILLLSIHGMSVAWDSQSAGVFLPNLESTERFVSWGGPPAYWLIWIAVAAAFARFTISRGWRAIHWLTYIAFLLATGHAVMLGTDFASQPARVAVYIMGGIVIAVFIRKRLVHMRG